MVVAIPNGEEKSEKSQPDQDKKAEAEQNEQSKQSEQSEQTQEKSRTEPKTEPNVQEPQTAQRQQQKESREDNNAAKAQKNADHKHQNQIPNQHPESDEIRSRISRDPNNAGGFSNYLRLGVLIVIAVGAALAVFLHFQGFVAEHHENILVPGSFFDKRVAIVVLLTLFLSLHALFYVSASLSREVLAPEVTVTAVEPGESEDVGRESQPKEKENRSRTCYQLFSSLGFFLLFSVPAVYGCLEVWTHEEAVDASGDSNLENLDSIFQEPPPIPPIHTKGCMLLTGRYANGTEHQYFGHAGPLAEKVLFTYYMF